LATITSEGENDFIIDNFFKKGYLGGSDADVEGDWRWVVGPEAGQLFFQGEYPDPNRHTFIYSDWGGNEPNDYVPVGGEDYLHFDNARGGEWNDCSDYPGYVPGFYVEFGGGVIPEPSTLIVWSLLGALGITVGWWRRRRKA